MKRDRERERNEKRQRERERVPLGPPHYSWLDGSRGKVQQSCCLGSKINTTGMSPFLKGTTWLSIYIWLPGRLLSRSLSFLYFIPLFLFLFFYLVLFSFMISLSISFSSVSLSLSIFPLTLFSIYFYFLSFVFFSLFLLTHWPLTCYHTTPVHFKARPLSPETYH